MSDLKVTERLCKAPLKIGVTKNPYEAVWARNPVTDEERIQNQMKPKLLNALESANSPCLNCKYKKFETHSDIMTHSLSATLCCGLGPNPVCPDMVPDIFVASWTEGLVSSRMGDCVAQIFYDPALHISGRNYDPREYQVNASAHTPAYIAAKEQIHSPPPRPKDQPATMSEGAW